MKPFNYLKFTMRNLSTILYNTSQGDAEWYSKDAILDSIKRIIQDYNDVVSSEDKIDYKDFRKCT
jgi:hypothetical protein